MQSASIQPRVAAVPAQIPSSSTTTTTTTGSPSPHSPSTAQSSHLRPSSSTLKPKSSWSHLFSKPNLPALTTRRGSTNSINSSGTHVDDVDLDSKEHAAPLRGPSMSGSLAITAPSSNSTPGNNQPPSTPSAASLLRRFSGSALPHTAEPSPTTNASTTFSSSSPGSIGRSMSAYKLMNGSALLKQSSVGGGRAGTGAVTGALLQINSSLATPSSVASTAPSTPMDVPKSSILLNPIRRRSVVDTWRWDSAGVNPALANGSPPLTILRVPAIPSARERREAAREAELAAEKAREREREKQREKEREAEDKLWGIPKKAFYLGLPDLNFNSQASMLAGWGNGSGTTDFRPTPRPPSAHGAHGRSHSVTSGGIGGGGESSRRDSTQRDRDRERERAEREREAEQQRKKEEEERAKNAEIDEPMDPEELAALNAIINTRRSAASAMALASGAVKFGEPSNARRGSAQQRPGLEDGRTASRESVPSRPSMSSRRDSNESSILGSPDKGSARIRFAPLPQPFGPLPANLAQVTPYPPSNAGDSATDLDVNRDQAMQQLTGAGLSRTDSLNDYADDETASDDEGWTRRFSSGKGKWYLMGMPSSVFKPQSYMSKRPRTADGADLERRVSTGSFGVVSSLEADRRGSLSATPSALTSSEEARGRRRARRRLSKSGRPASTRSNSVGSGDEDERQRRRELIRASRPGGTGMVTLPDGTKMKARRVADAETDYDEPDLNEWGFAGLAKEARRSMATEGATPACLGEAGFGETQDSAASAAEEAEGSDTVDGTLKRRRRDGSAQSVQMIESGHLVQEPLSIDTPSSESIEPPPIVVEKTLSPSLPLPPIAAQATSSAPMGLKLSAEKAAEVRRRHEDEVAALGAEVLANIHKNKAKAAAAAAESAHTRISSNGSDAPRLTAAKQQQQQQQQEQEQDRPATPKRKPSLSLPLRKPSLPTPARKQSSNTGTVTGPSTPRLGEQRLLEADEPVTPSAQSKSGKKELTSSGSATLSPRMASQQASPAAGSMRELSPAPSHASRTSRLTSPSESRLHMDPSVSIPIPSDRIPRRPDARGYSVVALPGQTLGMRPARPREGRVWQYDDDDEDFEDSETGDESEADVVSRSDDEEDEMDQEELEEEERRTAAQKKRATTRAAGQEVMSANKARTAKQSNAAADSFDSLMLAPRGAKPSPLRTTASSAALAKSKGSGKNVRGTTSLTSLGRKSRSSAPKPLTPPEVDEIDDAELWPPSIAQTMGSRRPSTAVREEHAVRAKLVRERRQREEKEKEKLEKQRKKEADADPDWGWVSARGGGPLGLGSATSFDANNAAARRSSSRPRNAK